MKPHSKPGPATWICSRCGHRAERPLTKAPIFEQLAKATCSSCGARGHAVVEQGSSEYGLEESFEALRTRNGGSSKKR